MPTVPTLLGPNNFTGQLLWLFGHRVSLSDFRQRRYGLLKRFGAYVSVMSAHRLGLVADQFHYDAFRNSGIFEQAYRSMSQGMKTKTICRPLASASFAFAPMRRSLAQSSSRQQIRKLVAEISGSPLTIYHGESFRMNRTTWLITDRQSLDMLPQWFRDRHQNPLRCFSTSQADFVSSQSTLSQVSDA